MLIEGMGYQRYLPPMSIFLCKQDLLFTWELGYLELKLSQTPLQLVV